MTEKINTKNILIRLPAELHFRLVQLSIEEDRPISRIVRAALDAYLQSRER